MSNDTPPKYKHRAFLMEEGPACIYGTVCIDRPQDDHPMIEAELSVVDCRGECVTLDVITAEQVDEAITAATQISQVLSAWRLALIKAQSWMKRREAAIREELENAE